MSSKRNAAQLLGVGTNPYYASANAHQTNPYDPYDASANAHQTNPYYQPKPDSTALASQYYASANAHQTNPYDPYYASANAHQTNPYYQPKPDSTALASQYSNPPRTNNYASDDRSAADYTFVNNAGSTKKTGKSTRRNVGLW